MLELRGVQEKFGAENVISRRAGGMNEPGRYPPPDFGSPPPRSVGAFQRQQPRSSSFHPGMWTWAETPTEAGSGWDSGFSAGCYHREAAGAGFGFTPGCGRPYDQKFGHQWHQGGHQGWRQNHAPHSQYGKKQKNKKEPEYSHYCDTCDRGFKNLEKYDEHVSQHVKCSVSDCTFMAHEKLVSIHWKNSHAPGAKRIKLDTEEEIAKWREERRKNYPTLQNIEKKKKLLEVRAETGGVLETAQFGRMRGRVRGRGRGRGRGNRWRNPGFRGQHPSDHDGAETPSSIIHPSRSGDPLGILASSDHDSDKEDAGPRSAAGGLVVAPKQMSSALGSLLANYGSMSDSEAEEDEVAATEPIQEYQKHLNVPPRPQDCRRSGDEDTSAEIHGGSGPNLDRKMQNSRRSRGGRVQDTPQTRRPTLLEMLLAPDIRHERNVLLQCVRFVVRNNFFGLSSRPQRGASEEVYHASQSASAGGGARPSSEGGALGPEALGTRKAVVDLSPLVDQVCPERLEEPENSIHHSVDVSRTDVATSASDMYEDEIWESTTVVM